jgi:hypothetical protein
MGFISDNTELLIQENLREARCVRFDGCEVYLASYQGDEYLRYIEGTRHVTFGTRSEKIEEMSIHAFLSSILSGRSPRAYVVVVEKPLTWDSLPETISSSHREVIIDRVKRAVLQKYLECKIESKAPRRRDLPA